MVLREGEAVLARNIEGDSTLVTRDSKGEIHATSVMCAPIREDQKVVGLIHLYSTDDQRMPDADDLEFTLAVADNVALALKTLARQQELSENLLQTKDEIVQLRKRLGAESRIIGSSPLMSKVHQEIARAAPVAPPCSFVAKAAWARNSSHGRSTSPARARAARLCV